jgi:hypothetical protein
MQLVGTRDLLALWDAGAGLDALGRALVLARHAADGDPTWAETAPIGHVVARLLEFRSAALEQPLEAVACCPRCPAQVEIPVDPCALLALEAKIVDEPQTLELDGWSVVWRPLTLVDIQQAARYDDVPAAELELVRRCVLSAVDGSGATLPGDRLPPSVRTALAAEIESADPLSELLLDVTCPGCQQEFPAELDVASFVWTEIDRVARVALLEVDTLARCYGWHEQEVLSLSASRRAAYLRIVREGAP